MRLPPHDAARLEHAMAYYEGRKPEYPTQPHDPWTWFEIIRAPFVAPFVLLAFLWVKLRH